MKRHERNQKNKLLREKIKIKLFKNETLKQKEKNKGNDQLINDCENEKDHKN